MSLVHSREIECKVSKEEKKSSQIETVPLLSHTHPASEFCLPNVTIHLLQKVKPACDG